MPKTLDYCADLDRLEQMLLDTPFPSRRPTGPHDFGDQYTCRLCVKQHDTSITDAYDPTHWGFYLGRHGDKFVVAIKDLLASIVGFVEYDSLDQLKEIWRLD